MTVTTSRALGDSVQNVLDYLVDSRLALYTNSVYQDPEHVTFNRFRPDAAFLIEHEHPGIDQYLDWVSTGSYSAVLSDASLLQLSYRLNGGVVGHRLTYMPCPFAVDEELLEEGEGIADVVELYRGSSDPLLRSPIRFDFDPSAAKPGHPASHFTINGEDCRIACVAPIHALRFADFVFRHFYPGLWQVHNGFFTAATSRHLGVPVLTDEDRRDVHLMWDVHAKSSA